MNTKQLIQYLAALKEWASPDAAGRARSVAMAQVKNLISSGFEGPAVSLPFGEQRGVVGIDGRGFRVQDSIRAIRSLSSKGVVPTPEIAKAISDHERVVSVSETIGWVDGVVSKAIPEGSAATNKMVGEIRIPCGLVIILGGGGVGKTSMAHALAGHGDADYELIRYGEPLSGYDHDMERTAQKVAASMMQSADIVLDSVKDVMALAGGAAMKSGIMRTVLPMFTQWATIAADMGCTLYVPVNPSSSDKDVIELMEEAAKSNSTSLILSQGGNNWRYVMRGGEGLMRESGDFETSFNKDGVMQFTSAKGRPNQVGSVITGTISDSDLSASIRRSLNAQY